MEENVWSYGYQCLHCWHENVILNVGNNFTQFIAINFKTVIYCWLQITLVLQIKVMVGICLNVWDFFFAMTAYFTLKTFLLVMFHALTHPLIFFTVLISCSTSQKCNDDRVGIKGLWFVNHELISWSYIQKICKTSIFHIFFF